MNNRTKSFAFFVLAVILAAVLLAACSPAASSGITFPKAGIKLTLPREWHALGERSGAKFTEAQKAELEGLGNPALVVMCPSESTDQFTDNLVVFFFEEDKTLFTNSREDNEALLTEGLDEVVVKDYEVITKWDRDTLHILYTFTSGEKTFRVDQYLVNKNGRLYNLTFTADAKTYSDNQAEMMKLFGSIEFIDIE